MQKRTIALKLSALAASLLLLAPWAFSNESHATLVVSGTVSSREEVWDRRNNPLMGRPDFLKEIRFRLALLEVHQGTLPSAVREIEVSVTDRSSLSKFRSLATGDKGRFYLEGQAQPFDLLEAKIEPSTRPRATPLRLSKPPLSPTPRPANSPFENVSARNLKASPSLQADVLRFMADHYHMSNAKLIYLTSFSGPMPPQGGYVYWGVTGMIRGKAHVWQQGSRQLRLGSNLIDPLRFQK